MKPKKHQFEDMPYDESLPFIIGTGQYQLYRENLKNVKQKPRIGFVRQSQAKQKAKK